MVINLKKNLDKKNDAIVLAVKHKNYENFDEENYLIYYAMMTKAL
jgi:hypothetical protein